MARHGLDRNLGARVVPLGDLFFAFVTSSRGARRSVRHTRELVRRVERTATAVEASVWEEVLTM